MFNAKRRLIDYVTLSLLAAMVGFANELLECVQFMKNLSTFVEVHLLPVFE